MAAGREGFPLHLWRYIAAFVALVAFAIVSMASIFAALETRQRQDQFQQLSALVQLKAGRIEAWLNERRQEIEALAANPALQAEIEHFTAHPEATAGIRLQERLQATRIMDNAIGIELYGNRGEPLLTVGRRIQEDQPPPRNSPTDTAQAVFIDFHRGTPDGPIHLAYEFPILRSENPPLPMASLRITLNPERSLYPLVRSWPLPSISGEALLVRQEGDTLLTLSELRYLGNSTLNSRLPMSTAGTATSQAGEGIYSGPDYRRVDVLAASRKVAGTPWILIAKVDETEVLGNLHGLKWLATGVTLSALWLGGLLLWQVWHRQSLRGRRALTRQLVDLAATVPGALFSFRLKPDGTAGFPYASPAMEELFGLTQAQLDNNAGAFFDLIHPEDVEQVRISLADSASQLSLWHQEFRITPRNRGLAWIEGRSTPQREADGAILWHGFIHDISERRTSQQALQRANERWRQLAEAMPQLVWICSPDRECQYLNQHWVDYTGRPAADQAGLAWLDTIHPEDRPRLDDALDHAAAGNGIVDGEFRLRRADGQYHWFKTHAVPVRDSPDAPPAWYGFNTDIQEIKEFEIALHRSLLRQQALQQLDRAVLEARLPEEVAARGLAHLASLLPCEKAAALAIDLGTGEGTVLASHGLEALGLMPGRRFHLANYGAQDLAFLEKGQIRVVADTDTQASRPPLVDSLHQKGMRSYIRIPLMMEGQLLGALSLGSDRVGHFGKAEVETARPIADIMAIALQQARLRHNQSQQTATLEMRVQERTAELERMKNQAEAANRAKSQFLANISQELRTPLNSLLILSEMLADNAQENLTPEQRGFARVIHNAGNDLLGLINDILDISKIETGRAAVHGGDIGFDAVLDHIDQLFRNTAEDKGLRFDLRLEEGLPGFIHTDLDHLKPILRNLVANAVKFTDTGSVSLRVHPAKAGWHPNHPTLAKAGTAIAFEVKDTGIGIPGERLALIFDAFAQADACMPRRYGGTGLGLHIARVNAGLLGGDLTVTSTPGQGSTFTLYLPQIYDAPINIPAQRLLDEI